jgi:uncharacterized membrane protein
MKKAYYFAIGVIVAFGVFLRIYPLNFPFSHDEWYTYDIIGRGFVDMNVQMYNDVHVPLYFYIAKLFSIIFGMSEINLRILSVIFGVIGIIVFAKFALDFFGKRAALLATGVVSLSIFHMSYSQIARMYSLLFLLAVISLYFLFSLLFKPKKYSRPGYIFANLALLYTHIFGVFVLLFNVVILYKFRQKIVDSKKLIWSHLIIFVAALPVWFFILVQIIRKINGTSYGNWMPPTKFSDIYATFSAMSSNDILVIPFLILFAYFIASHFIRKNEDHKNSNSYLTERILIIGLGVCFAFPSIITLITPLFAWRYFFIMYPIFILCICLVLEKIFFQNKAAYFILVFAVFILLGLSDIVDINKKNGDQIQQSLCVQVIKNQIAKYEKLNTAFVTSRWLNEWVEKHRPIIAAHQHFEDIFLVKTILINDYHTDISYLLRDHKYIMNVSPSEWGETFIRTDNLKGIAKGDCYGYHYKIYGKI